MSSSLRGSSASRPLHRLAHLLGLGLLLVGGAGLGPACDSGTIGGADEESDESDVTEGGTGAVGSGSGGAGTGSGTGSGPSTGTGSDTTTSGTGSGSGGASTTSSGTGDTTSSGTGDTTSTGTGDTTSTGTGGPACGDGTCDAGETCETCSSDCGACAECAGASDATTALDAEEQAFLVLINDHRAANGLAPLSACTSLSRAAQGHSEDMRDQDYFSHTGLNGSSPGDRACDACYEGACSFGSAENIAAGNSGAAATFEQWRNSPGHNANMLGGYGVIGIGRATGGGTYGTYWTNVFGSSSEPSCN